MEEALSDVRVLDLTHYIAGPYCTRVLADYGADVIKVERPGCGDVTRRMGPFLGDDFHPEKSGFFLHLNTNKKGITLNLKTESGIAIFKELLKQADILVESFAPRVMPSLGLDYETLAGINPKLVMTSISNFGQTGPYRDYRATELTLFAMGPHMYGEGSPGREPLKYPGHKAQYLAGSHAATAALGAFFGSSATGEGQQVDVSIMECLSAPPEGAGTLMNSAFSGINQQRIGHRREGFYPWGVYPVKDGYILIYGIIPAFWPRILKWMGREDLLTDERFSTLFAKIMHHADFDTILLPWLLERTRTEAVETAQAQRIPVTPVYTIDEVVGDAQYNARDFFQEVEHPVMGKVRCPGVPFRMPEAPTKPQRAAPLLGEHNREIYGRLGYKEGDLVKLRERGII